MQPDTIIIRTQSQLNSLIVRLTHFQIRSRPRHPKTLEFPPRRHGPAGGSRSDSDDGGDGNDGREARRTEEEEGERRRGRGRGRGRGREGGGRRGGLRRRWVGGWLEKPPGQNWENPARQAAATAL